MKLVKFLRPRQPYNAGEQAGFSEEDAERLVSDGSAVYVEEEDEEDGVKTGKDKMVRGAANTQMSPEKGKMVTKGGADDDDDVGETKERGRAQGSKEEPKKGSHR